MILLTTINARYHHSAFGLRCLFAQMGELEGRTRLIEFTLEKSPREIAEEILASKPRIVGLGVYIWNATASLEVARILKKVSPEIVLILGGPEVSYETESQEIARWADFVIPGEADLLFVQLCREILDREVRGSANPEWRVSKLRRGILPELSVLRSPYRHYTDEDIRSRVIYVEASRGCPYKCEYCLSSLDLKVRSFPLDSFLAEMSRLLERGARSFKFIDRTFNLSEPVSVAILEFFLRHVELGLFLHFEMVPDRLPSELRELIRRFPAGALQFEVGIQTLNPEVAANVSRRNDLGRTRENFRFLHEESGVHVHADLIVGLPGESLASFGRGLDELRGMGPQEIQVGILKRLRGAPIARHDAAFGMVYESEPPYAILKNRDLSFEEVQEMTRFARFWDLIVNSGEFTGTVRVLERSPVAAESWFVFFRVLAAGLHSRLRRTHKIALVALARALHETALELGVEREALEQALIEDYSVRGRRDVPDFLTRPESRAGASTKSASGSGSNSEFKARASEQAAPGAGNSASSRQNKHRR